MPLGALFGVLGLLLTLYGAATRGQPGTEPTGVPIDLIWGVVLFAFGLWMLLLARERVDPAGRFNLVLLLGGGGGTRGNRPADAAGRAVRSAGPAAHPVRRRDARPTGHGADRRTDRPDLGRRAVRVRAVDAAARPPRAAGAQGVACTMGVTSEENTR